MACSTPAPCFETSQASSAAPDRGTSDAALAVDLTILALVGAAVCFWSQQLVWMTLLVAAAWIGRLALWRALGLAPLGRELVFLTACTVLGGANDWLSVVAFGVYDYRVPVWFPELSTIPMWMLLYWGLILRAMATLGHWRRPATGQPLSRLAALVALVLATRQAIYRLYDHPLGSWIPFAVALLLFVLLIRPPVRNLLLAALVALLGTLVEMGLIHWGQLHHYQLGWLGGVPVWIVLWWALGFLVWRELSSKMLTFLDERCRVTLNDATRPQQDRP